MLAVGKCTPVGICRIAALLVVTLALVASSAACGSAVYIKRSTIDASASVAAAKAVDAETWAPYEYTRAVEYLHKSREEASYADFQAANRFAKLAHEAAIAARKLAVARAADPSKDDWRPPASLRQGGATEPAASPEPADQDPPGAPPSAAPADQDQPGVDATAAPAPAPDAAQDPGDAAGTAPRPDGDQ